MDSGPEQEQARIEEVRHQVEQEIAETPGGIDAYLNNFPRNLISDEEFSLANYRSIVQDRLNKRIGDTLKEMDKRHFSNYYLGKTYEEFFADIDRSAESEGFVGKRREELEKQIKQKRKSTQTNETILPIYFRLRAMGYKHQELTV